MSSDIIVQLSNTVNYSARDRYSILRIIVFFFGLDDLFSLRICNCRLLLYGYHWDLIIIFRLYLIRAVNRIGRFRLEIAERLVWKWPQVIPSFASKWVLRTRSSSFYIDVVGFSVIIFFLFYLYYWSWFLRIKFDDDSIICHVYQSGDQVVC